MSIYCSKNLIVMRSLFVLFMMTLFLSSCVTIGTVQLEVLRPAQDSSLVFNRTLTLSNAYIDENKSSESDFENLVEYDKFRLDSLVSVESLRAVFGQISNAGISVVSHYDSVKLINIPNEWNVQLKKVDILSQVETDPIYIGSRGEYYASVMVSYLVQWQIVYNNEVVQTKVYQDTVWAEGFRRSFETLAQLVNFDEVIKYIIDKAAVEYARTISPTWNTVVRYYINSGNNDFSRAAYFMSKGEYDNSAQLWQKYLAIGDKRIASAAHLNMAVYYELKGDLDEAMVFAKKAMDLNNALAAKYVKALEQRQKEIGILMQKYNN